MTPKELLDAAARRPTVSSLDEELSLIRDIRALDPADIGKDIASFVSLIEIVRISHVDNGIFEMGEPEEAHAVGFFNWLKSLEEKLGAPLTRYADGLDLTCAEVAKKMPR
jgi:hypothetical protein